jgi:importin subunit alpha-1
MLRNSTWSLSNLCRGKPAPNFQIVRISLPVLARLIHYTDQEVLADACWALSYLSDGDNNQIQAVIDSGICDRIVQLLSHPSSSVQTPALRVVGNIVSGDDDKQTDILLKAEVLPHLGVLLSHPKKVIKKECCWTISNITAGTKQQIQAVFDANMVPPLIKLLSSSEFDVKKEAAWAVSNAASGGSMMQIKYLVSQGAIKPLCDLLALADNKLIMVALEAVEGILRVGEKLKSSNTDGVNPYARFVEEAEGLDKIESLQKHSSEEIYKKAVEILENYFDAEEDPNMVPDATGNSFNFTVAPPPTGGFSFYGK